jgi:hypothetical protein
MVGDFSRRLTVSNAQAMTCALKFNEILNGLPGTVVAFLEPSQEHRSHSLLKMNSVSTI